MTTPSTRSTPPWPRTAPSFSVAADTLVDGLIELLFYSDGHGVAGHVQPAVDDPGRSGQPAGRRRDLRRHRRATSTCTNAVTQVVVDEGATGRALQDPGRTRHRIPSRAARRPPGPRQPVLVALGRTRVEDRPPRSTGAPRGRRRPHQHRTACTCPEATSHHDNPILIEHAAPRCTSRQLYKGIVNDRGHGVFNGRIVVLPDAPGTDASQTNKNLLLSDHAEIDTRPRLEILTDDVKCTHGAAVGALDHDAIFYLRSRGVPLEPAKAMLTYAFAREMLDLIPVEPLRTHLETLVADRLSTERRRDRGHTPVSSDLAGMYQEVIIDHGRSPHNFRKLEDATRTVEGVNRLCGDAAHPLRGTHRRSHQ